MTIDTSKDQFRTYNRDGFYTVVKLSYDGEGNLAKVEGPVFPLSDSVDGLRLQMLKMAQAVENSPMNADTLARITHDEVEVYLDGDGVPSLDAEVIEEQGSFTDSSDVLEERGAVAEEQRRAEVLAEQQRVEE